MKVLKNLQTVAALYGLLSCFWVLSEYFYCSTSKKLNLRGLLGGKFRMEIFKSLLLQLVKGNPFLLMVFDSCQLEFFTKFLSGHKYAPHMIVFGYFQCLPYGEHIKINGSGSFHVWGVLNTFWILVTPLRRVSSFGVEYFREVEKDEITEKDSEWHRGMVLL